MGKIARLKAQIVAEALDRRSQNRSAQVRRSGRPEYSSRSGESGGILDRKGKSLL